MQVFNRYRYAIKWYFKCMQTNSKILDNIQYSTSLLNLFLAFFRFVLYYWNVCAKSQFLLPGTRGDLLIHQQEKAVHRCTEATVLAKLYRLSCWFQSTKWFGHGDDSKWKVRVQHFIEHSMSTITIIIKCSVNVMDIVLLTWLEINWR